MVNNKLYHSQFLTQIELPSPQSFGTTSEWGCGVAGVHFWLVTMYYVLPSVDQTWAFPSPSVGHNCFRLGFPGSGLCLTRKRFISVCSWDPCCGRETEGAGLGRRRIELWQLRQDNSISQSAPGYLLLRLSLESVWLTSRGSFLPLCSCSWKRDSTWGTASPRIPMLEKTSVDSPAIAQLLLSYQPTIYSKCQRLSKPSFTSSSLDVQMMVASANIWVQLYQRPLEWMAQPSFPQISNQYLKNKVKYLLP